MKIVTEGADEEECVAIIGRLVTKREHPHASTALNPGRVNEYRVQAVFYKEQRISLVLPAQLALAS